MFVYEYTDDLPRDFPTLGLRDVTKGEQVTSDVALVNPFLKDVTPKKSGTKGSGE